MNIPEFCVKRPIFISMVSCIVLILGGVALSYLPVDLMPDITYPGVTIVTTYEDASPEEVEELISKKIETALSAVSGVKEITSTSGEGSSNVTVSFNWGTNLDAAVSDVRDRLDRVEPRLPDDADKPILYKFDSASSPIMRIGVATDIDLLDARKLIEDQIQYRLERIDGVASIEIHGGLEREIQVLFDVERHDAGRQPARGPYRSPRPHPRNLHLGRADPRHGHRYRQKRRKDPARRRGRSHRHP